MYDSHDDMCKICECSGGVWVEPCLPLMYCDTPLKQCEGTYLPDGACCPVCKPTMNNKSNASFISLPGRSAMESHSVATCIERRTFVCLIRSKRATVRLTRVLCRHVLYISRKETFVQCPICQSYRDNQYNPRLRSGLKSVGLRSSSNAGSCKLFKSNVFNNYFMNVPWI